VGLKQFNSRLLGIDSQTLWRLFASLVRNRFWLVAQFGHANYTRVILKDSGRATALADAGGAYPVPARSFAKLRMTHMRWGHSD